MRIEKKSKALDVCIQYSSIWGHAMRAANLAKIVEHCFEIPLKLQLQTDGSFEITVDGMSVFKEQGPCDPHWRPDFLIDILKKHTQQVRSLEETPVKSDTEDARHREWMRSVCSGE